MQDLLKNSWLKISHISLQIFLDRISSWVFWGRFLVALSRLVLLDHYMKQFVSTFVHGNLRVPRPNATFPPQIKAFWTYYFGNHGWLTTPKTMRLNRARQHRERQAAEEQQRRQQAAAQLAAQLAAKRAREERMRAPEQVGRKMVARRKPVSGWKI